MGKHSIQLTSSEPIRIKAWYHLPFAPREAVDKELDSMSANGVIEPSATSYALQIVVVKNLMAPMAYPLIPVSWIRSQFLIRGLCNKCEMFYGWIEWKSISSKFDFVNDIGKFPCVRRIKTSRLRFARDLWRFTNVHWLIDWFTTFVAHRRLFR